MALPDTPPPSNLAVREIGESLMAAEVTGIDVATDCVAVSRHGDVLRYGDNRQVMDSGFVLTDELRNELGDVATMSFGGLDDRRPGLFVTFHTDDSCVERPALASVLHARALPPWGGGDTTFITCGPPTDSSMRRHRIA